MPHPLPVTVAMPTTVPTPSVDIPTARDKAAAAFVSAAAVATSDAMRGLATYEKHAAALLTPPDSVSPHLQAVADDDDQEAPASLGMPLSKGALSGLDAAAAITPAMLARDHLPGIMLGNGPRPIRYIMGELTQSLPGFSRIPSAKARRLVVAALESRQGGGRDGNITFYKTGWGKWDAHVKGSSRDSAIGSFNDARGFSPPRSERSFAMSHTDSAVHMPGPRLPSGYRDPLSGESWTASSIREEDELNMDMDVPENEADKMSLDGMSEEDDEDGSEDMEDDATDDEEDWSAVGPEALRKASVATAGAPRRNYNALSSSYSRWSSRNWNRRQSGTRDPSMQARSLPYGHQFHSMDPALASPEEKAAVAALMSMGSM